MVYTVLMAMKYTGLINTLVMTGGWKHFDLTFGREYSMRYRVKNMLLSLLRGNRI